MNYAVQAMQEKPSDKNAELINEGIVQILCPDIVTATTYGKLLSLPIGEVHNVVDKIRVIEFRIIMELEKNEEGIWHEPTQIDRMIEEVE